MHKKCTLLGMGNRVVAKPGESIRDLRTLARLTLAEVAAGTSESYLSRVETGAVAFSTQYVARVTAAIARLMQRDAA
jgi:transcriptional regulator with XRE-family HTH domain